MLLGEAFFRIGALIVNNTKTGASTQDKNSYTILCIGDSSTYGIGATDIEQFSYPVLLENLLKKNNPEMHYNVINKGLPGINSSQVLNRFSNNILEVNPDLVIMQVGVNDWWNLEESNIMKYYNENFIRKLLLGAELIINRLKLYQFFKLVFVSDNVSNESENLDNNISSLKEELNIAQFNNENKSKGFWFSYSDPMKTVALYHALNENITKIVQLAEKNHISIIFMKYHIGGEWHMASGHLSKIYTQLNVPFIDNKISFEEAKRKGLNVFGNDNWHPGDLGYSLIAKNIYNKLVELKIIKGIEIEMFAKE